MSRSSAMLPRSRCLIQSALCPSSTRSWVLGVMRRRPAPLVRRLPLATVRSAVRMVKRIKPLLGASCSKLNASPGRTAPRNLADPTCHCVRSMPQVRCMTCSASSSRTAPGSTGKLWEVAGVRWVVSRDFDRSVHGEGGSHAHGASLVCKWWSARRCSACCGSLPVALRGSRSTRINGRGRNTGSIRCRR